LTALSGITSQNVKGLYIQSKIKGYRGFRPLAKLAPTRGANAQPVTRDQGFMAIVLNKPLPEFEANATGGLKVSNISHIGQTIILYFYPKDNTPGCTTEAMQFRDKYNDFVEAGALVLGVSRDNMKSHDDFKTNLELPFELIADTEEKMCHMFGVVKNKIMYGKKVKGIERSTFLIGADGTLKQEWRGLKVPGHVEEVLQAVKDLKQAE
jgi:thioredoxin-dependent peroxiredoxin